MKNEDLSSSESSSSSSDDDIFSDEDEQNSPSNDVKMKSMLTFLSDGGVKVNPNYTVGSSKWRDLWSVAINAMSGTTGQRYRISEKSDYFPSLCKGPKTAEEKSTEVKSLPIIPAKSFLTNDRINIPHPGVASESGSIRDVVGILTSEKKMYLLKVLSKMEANLEMMDISSGIGVKKAPRMKTSENLKYACDKKLKYGRTASGHGEINGILRKIGAMLKSSSGKKMLPTILSVRTQVLSCIILMFSIAR